MVAGSPLRQIGHWLVGGAEEERRLAHRCLESIWCLVGWEAERGSAQFLVTLTHSSHTTFHSSFLYPALIQFARKKFIGGSTPHYRPGSCIGLLEGLNKNLHKFIRNKGTGTNQLITQNEGQDVRALKSKLHTGNSQFVSY